MTGARPKSREEAQTQRGENPHRDRGQLSGATYVLLWSGGEARTLHRKLVGLKETDILSLTVLDARHPKPRCWQG